MMGIDLFVVIERFFQGTILFVLKFFSTLFLIAAAPKTYPLVAFQKFQSKKDREIGPATFLAICSIIFFTTLMWLAFAIGQIFETTNILSTLVASDTATLRAPFAAILIGGMGTVVAVELICRLVNLSRRRLTDQEDEGYDFEKLRAVAFYTVGVGLLYPSGAIGLTLLFTSLDSSLVVLFVPVFVLVGPLWPIVSVVPVVRFLHSSNSVALGFAIYFALYGALFGVIILVFSFFSTLSEGPRVLISNLTCEQKGDQVIALVELRNESSRAAILNTDPKKWHVNITFGPFDRLFLFFVRAGEPFRADAINIEFEDKQNVESSVIKPSETKYVVLHFSIPSNHITGSVICDVSSDSVLRFFTRMQLLN